jgi:hypothetical protein
VCFSKERCEEWDIPIIAGMRDYVSELCGRTTATSLRPL